MFKLRLKLLKPFDTQKYLIGYAMPKGVYIRTEEIKRRISAGRKGMKLSDEHKRRISESQMGRMAGNWKGGRIKDSRGYMLVHCPNHPHAISHGYVREHRLVMERKLGRLLNRKEVVHHINGIIDDNREENLELIENQSLHLINNCPWKKQKQQSQEAI